MKRKEEIVVLRDYILSTLTSFMGQDEISITISQLEKDTLINRFISDIHHIGSAVNDYILNQCTDVVDKGRESW